MLVYIMARLVFQKLLKNLFNLVLKLAKTNSLHYSDLSKIAVTVSLCIE